MSESASLPGNGAYAAPNPVPMARQTKPKTIDGKKCRGRFGMVLKGRNPTTRVAKSQQRLLCSSSMETTRISSGAITSSLFGFIIHFPRTTSKVLSSKYTVTIGSTLNLCANTESLPVVQITKGKSSVPGSGLGGSLEALLYL
eukprot:GHVT01018143.1.p1 GENE.GHVT01018143.1~~GHVT01018143.1.p1  ORF type:complete len:143 (+),score=1.56 GHVT01018143.1:262-690(+)